MSSLRSHLNMSTVLIVLLPYTMALGAVDTGREKAYEQAMAAGRVRNT